MDIFIFSVSFLFKSGLPVLPKVILWARSYNTVAIKSQGLLTLSPTLAHILPLPLAAVSVSSHVWIE